MARNKASYPVLNGAGTILEAVPAIDPYDYADQIGTTAGRPITTVEKLEYLDTDLMMVIYWNQARGVWTDHMGTQR